MQKRIVRILLIALCVMTLSLAGFINARKALAAGPEPSTSPTTGKIDVHFSITIHSNIPTTDTVACEVTAIVVGEQTTFREVAARAGARSGNHVGCDVPIPYSWLLQHPSGDSINLVFDTVAPPETSPTVSLPYRLSESSGSISPMPANGATTDVSVDVAF